MDRGEDRRTKRTERSRAPKGRELRRGAGAATKSTLTQRPPPPRTLRRREAEGAVPSRILGGKPFLQPPMSCGPLSPAERRSARRRHATDPPPRVVVVPPVAAEENCCSILWSPERKCRKMDPSSDLEYSSLPVLTLGPSTPRMPKGSSSWWRFGRRLVYYRRIGLL